MTINNLSHRGSLPACRQVLHCHIEGAYLPRLLHNSKMCHFDRREKSHAQLVHQSYTLDFSSVHLPADRQVLHCPIEWSLPTETIAQLQNVSFRPEGEIPCSTRILKLYMGFFLFSPACR